MLPTNFLLLAAAAIPMATALRSKTQDGPGVFGWCDFTWANANKVQNVQCGAGDRAGDSHPVFSELELYSDNGKEKVIARYDFSGGNGKQGWDDTKYSWSNLPRSNLSKARVKACVNVQAGTDTPCYWGNWVDNPYEAGTSKKREIEFVA